MNSQTQNLHIKESSNKETHIEEKEEGKKEEPAVKTFYLGDEYHPINPEDEIIEFIGERIRALENLENCKSLKVRKTFY